MVIAATLDPVKLAAVLDVTAIPAGSTTITVSRKGPSGIAANVRGATKASVSGTTFNVHDYEIPLGVTVTYTAEAFNASGTSLGTATVLFTIAYTDCEAWLVDIARPTNSLQIMVESMSELAFPVPAGVHRVLDRRAPVVTALPAWTPTSDLHLLVGSLDERDNVRAVLGTGYPILLRTSPELGVGNMYLAVTGFTEERLVTLGAAPERRFRVDVVQVDRPDPSVYVPTAPNTYANVRNTYSSYSALKAAVASYQALAYLYPPGVLDPVTPWPPDDV